MISYRQIALTLQISNPIPLPRHHPIRVPHPGSTYSAYREERVGQSKCQICGGIGAAWWICAYAGRFRAFEIWDFVRVKWLWRCVIVFVLLRWDIRLLNKSFCSTWSQCHWSFWGPVIGVDLHGSSTVQEGVIIEQGIETTGFVEY